MNFRLKAILCSFAIASFAMVGGSHAQVPGFTDPGARQAGRASGGFVPVEEEVAGGIIQTGSTAQVVVRFRNETTQPIETGLIRLYPSSNVTAEVSLNQCSDEPLASGAECAVAVSVQGLQAGAWRVEMLMSHNGRSRLAATTLSGTVEATADSSDRLQSDIELIPNEVDFESLDSAQTLVQPVILRNVTSREITIEDISIDASVSSGFSLSTECESLKAGQACIASVYWSPQIRGPSRGVLVVKHTGQTALSSVLLRGEFEPESEEEADIFPEAVPGKGLLVSSETELNFGDEVISASAITAALVNAGDADLVINDVVISGSDNGVSYKESGCGPGTVLEPSTACPLTINWAPTREGAVLDDVQILHTGARGVLVLPIRGTALQTVSQDQQAIRLTDSQPQNLFFDPVSDTSGTTGDLPNLDDGSGVRGPSVPPQQADPERGRVASAPRRASRIPIPANAASVLDGFRITSFASDRAIINGPGGSRIIFDQEQTTIGGVLWLVEIQENGIEFATQDNQRVLLLFDRSLSSINRIPSQSESSSNTVTSSSGSSGGGSGDGNASSGDLSGSF